MKELLDKRCLHFSLRNISKNRPKYDNNKIVEATNIAKHHEIVIYYSSLYRNLVRNVYQYSKVLKKIKLFWVDCIVEVEVIQSFWFKKVH